MEKTQNMNPVHKFKVNIQWMQNPAVYIATSPDIPGLTLEAATIHEIMQEATSVIPHLLYHNCGMRPSHEIEVHFSQDSSASSNSVTPNPKWVLDQDIAAAIAA